MPERCKRRARRRRAPGMFGFLVLATILGGQSLAQADPGLRPFTANYVVSRDNTQLGERKLELLRGDNGTFVYRSRMRTTGLVALFKKYRVTEESRWILAGRHIRPLEYAYRKIDGDENRDVRLVFDWNRKIVTNRINGDPWQMSVPEGAQDKLAYMLALRRDLKRGARRLEYPVADGGKLKTYRFRVLKPVRLETALGPLDTLKVERVRDSDERETYLWCATALDYLPVRIDHRKEDERLSMRIRKLEGMEHRR